jgi:hypothetical protein
MNHADIRNIRAHAAMRSLQQCFDNMPEPEPSPAAAMHEAIRIAEEYIARAERALQSDNLEAAADHLRVAAAELQDVAP